jgi:RNA polymerase sigma-70 factor (ECF subfamily)
MADDRTAEFERMLDAFGPRLRAVAAGILGRCDEADEVVQEGFLTLWKTPPRETGEGAVYCWLRRVVTNLCINRLRRRRAGEPETEAADPSEDRRPDPGAADPAYEAETTELAALCRGLINDLSPEKRAVLTLRAVEDMSYEQIADELGCSLGTVMSRLHRARRELLGRLERLGLGVSERSGEITVLRRAARR